MPLLPSKVEDALANIAAMRHQEETGYTKADYLSFSNKNIATLQQSCVCSDNELAAVDKSCHSKMATWCYQVVGFCEFDRETVDIAMNYFTRFMMTPKGQSYIKDRRMYQLASMTCFYTAVKIHEPTAMDPNLVANLSGGAHTEQEVEHMESIILSALQWRMNPPTALSFVRRMLFDLIPDEVISKPMKRSIYDMTKLQIEYAVKEYDYVTVKSSTLAYTSLLNSLECCFCCQQYLDTQLFNYVAFVWGQAIDEQVPATTTGTTTTNNSNVVMNIRRCLYLAVVDKNTTQLNSILPACTDSNNDNNKSSSSTAYQSCTSNNNSSNEIPPSHEVSPRQITAWQ